MKVAKKVFLMALMIWMIWFITSYAATGTINMAQGVRMRKEPTTSSSVVAVVSNGETVEIVEKSGEWYKVTYGKDTGYIRGDLMKITGEITEPTPEPEITEPSTPETPEKPEAQEPSAEKPQEENTEAQEEVFQEVEKQVSSDTVIRILPSLSASKTGELKAKEKVTVIQVINAWSCIRYENKTAWLPSLFLENVTEEETPQIPTTKTGYINVAGAIIRKGPSTSAEIITEWGRNKPVEIVGEEGDWYKLNFNGEEAYVAKRLISDTVTSTSRNSQTEREMQEDMAVVEQEQTTASVQEESNVPVQEEPNVPVKEESNALTQEEIEKIEEITTPKQEETVVKTIYVNVAVANLRQESNTSSDIVGRANRKESLEVVGEENGWYKLKIGNGTAYILKSLTVDNIKEVAIPQEQTAVEETKAPSESTQATTGEAVVALAKQYLGCSYVYGGSGPKSFDCSGFTQYIYKQFGISLTHSAVAQANNGTYVEKSNLQLGDLVIFRDWDNSSIGHCGIYIGGGNFIHAANSNRGVVTDTLNSGYYYTRYVSGRRLF